MNAPKIDKGIPLPEGWGRDSSKFNLTATLRKMEVGDSFVMPPNYKDLSLPEVQRRVLNGSSIHKPKRFTTRMVEEDGVRVVRVWRIE